MERYIRIVLDTDYCGTRDEYCIKTDKSDRELDAEIIELARDHAEQYSDIVYGFDVSVEEYAEDSGITIEEAEQEMEAFYEDALAASYWEETTKEEYENSDWR